MHKYTKLKQMKTSVNNRKASGSSIILLIIVLLNAVIANHAFIHNSNWYWALLFTLPLLVLTAFYVRQKST